MWISIDPEAKLPMFRQVFEALRGAILSGTLASGFKLPSTRELAAELGVSRNVILEAYELLMSEGYITGRSGSGTFVAEGARLEGYAPEAPAERQQAAELTGDAVPAPGGISFRTGRPALEFFPVKQWASALQEVCLEASPDDLSYGDPAGAPELRRVLAEHLWRTRGVVCRPERILVTNGALQALQIIVRLLLGCGDEAVVEDPSNEDLRSVLTATGASLRLLPVDEDGLMTRELPRDGIRPKCIYVTPSHQFPMGGILPVQRRIELARYVQGRDSWIIEDDYDSEFRYDGPPVHSLQSLCPEHVIYIGTFSKTLFPSLRIGYMVLPERFVERARQIKRLSDYQTPTLEQLALARFMGSGHLSTHVHRMKKIYKKRRAHLLQALHEQLGSGFRVWGRPAGLHLVLELETPLPPDFERHLHEHGVTAAVLPGRRLLLGYGHLAEEQLTEGVRRICSALRRGQKDLSLQALF
ncbi:PLP-dependent aminotransferase family protein [Paenibacillus mucilaginosus]|uniref:Transcriptional regulator, GntR n=1 Tax=Paenibacillus mucilaginosus (strain KNP414) TaxID=1036673 RepID=F8F6Q0_PAEMK|nr:PLP-dependent aminotransferase family protein [Paenibacillus mucilaginosus]AEI43566.1 Transcriptional regulator, GntR [Paenibacillus mucilaginosus KNP414]MCG7211896.1 PLP-dependent aminotransferase family protein [Paenibacillus mucilaginosus]WDM25103.1 PLP-dependent aminotransferase family protein [Paenibacillus mucilaginosus]